MTELIVTAFALAVFVGYVFLRTPARDWVKYLLIVVVLCASTFAAHVVVGYLGYAVDAQLPVQAKLLKYRVVMDGGRKAGIELWLLEERSRLYAIPYSQEAEKKLKEAAGKPGVVVKRKDAPKDKPEFETDILTPEQESPKIPREPEVEVEPEKPADHWDKDAPTAALPPSLLAVSNDQEYAIQRLSEAAIRDAAEMRKRCGARRGCQSVAIHVRRLAELATNPRLPMEQRTTAITAALDTLMTANVMLSD